MLAFDYAVMAFCLTLDPIIEKHGGRVSSWGRPRTHNDAVGGNRYSFHLFRLAKDVVAVADPDAFALDCKEQGLEAVVYDTHVHVEFDLKSVIHKLVDGGKTYLGRIA